MNRRNWIMVLVTTLLWPLRRLPRTGNEPWKEARSNMFYNEKLGKWESNIMTKEEVVEKSKIEGYTAVRDKEVISRGKAKDGKVSWMVYWTAVVLSLLLFFQESRADWLDFAKPETQTNRIRFVEVAKKPLIVRRAILGRPFLSKATNLSQLGSRRWRSLLLFDREDDQSIKDMESCLSFVEKEHLPEMVYVPSCTETQRSRLLGNRRSSRLPLVAFDYRDASRGSRWQRLWSTPDNYLRDLAIVRRRASARATRVETIPEMIISPSRPSNSSSYLKSRSVIRQRSRGIFFRRGYSASSCST